MQKVASVLLVWLADGEIQSCFTKIEFPAYFICTMLNMLISTTLMLALMTQVVKFRDLISLVCDWLLGWGLAGNSTNRQHKQYKYKHYVIPQLLLPVHH